jgi:Fe2+ transport system protein FeoA
MYVKYIVDPIDIQNYNLYNLIDNDYHIQLMIFMGYIIAGVKIMMTTLKQIPTGMAGTIRKIGNGHAAKERLESLGLIAGVEIAVIRKSPLGGIRIYKCLNTLIALRNDIVEKICVEVDDEQK